MRKLTTILLLFISFISFSQDFREIGWKTDVLNVQLLSVDTFKLDAEPKDFNDKGAATREIGNYFLDWVARSFKIIDSDATTITVVDLAGENTAPQSGQIGIVYQSVEGGDSLFMSIGGIDVSVIDELSRWKEVARNNELFARAIKSLTSMPADSVTIATGVGDPTVDQMQLYMDNIGSSGFFLGGELTDGGSGTLDVAAGSGFIRTTNDNNAELQSFKWSASAAIAVTDNTTQYVYVDDSGVISLSTDEFLETPDNILIGVVTDELGAIESTFSLGVRLDESIGQAGRFIRRVHSVTRDKRKGGLIFGQSGDANRDMTISSGVLWWGRTEYPISSFNTSGADVFTTYSAGGQESTTASQWPNDQYDNSGTLTTMTNNRWANLFFYIEPDDNIVMMYGRDQFVSQSQAEEEDVPSTSLPSRVSETAILAAKFTFKKGSNTATISSAFEQLFANAGVSSHADLAGLDYASAGHTGFVSDANLTDSLNIIRDTTDALRIDIDQNASDKLSKIVNDSTGIGIETLFGGSIPGFSGSSARIQVNGFMRTGNIYVHEGGNTPNGNAKFLSNDLGDLLWDAKTIYNVGNSNLSTIDWNAKILKGQDVEIKGLSPKLQFEDENTGSIGDIDANAPDGSIAVNVNVNSIGTTAALRFRINNSEVFKLSNNGDADLVGNLTASSLSITNGATVGDAPVLPNDVVILSTLTGGGLDAEFNSLDINQNIDANGFADVNYLILTERASTPSAITSKGILYVTATDDQPNFRQSNGDIYSVDLTFASDFWKKKNFKLINNPLDKILALQSYHFDWNRDIPKVAPTGSINLEVIENNGKWEATGLIAQEAEKIIPEIVSEVDESGYLQVDYKMLVPYLIEAIKEQQKQIDELKNLIK